MLQLPPFELKSKKWTGVSGGMEEQILPDSIAPEDAILVAFWWRLPLDHDGLVGPATSNDVLRWSTGWLLWERDAEGHTQKSTHMKTEGG